MSFFCRSPELLDVDPSSAKTVDIANIVTDKNRNATTTFCGQRSLKGIPERANSDNFIDDPDVPPLM